MEGPTDWIGETFTSDEGWSHLETLVNLRDRMAGSEGERLGAEATRDAFERHTREAHLDKFSIPRWEREGSELRTPSGDEPCFALPRSPPGTATGPVFDAGCGLPEDFEGADGCVVVTSSDTPDTYDRFVHRREKYFRAIEAGAVGFVFRNHIDGFLAPTGGVGGRNGPYGEVPAVGVSKETGKRLVRRHEDEEVRVTVDASTNDDGGEAESANVHAELGPQTDEHILVTSHVDAHDISEGALDNGAGVATCVEIAKALSSREEELGKRVEFVAYGAEEVGLLGSRRHASRVGRDEVAAVVNVDGVTRSRDLSFYTHGFRTLAETARETCDALDHPGKVVDAPSPHSDHWSFVKLGLPGYHVKSATEGRDRGWGHTAADTIDKIDVRDLREAAIVVTELVLRLTQKETASKEVDKIRSMLREHGYEEGMRATGNWV